MSSSPVLLTSAGMTLEDLYRVAVERAPLEVAPEVWARVEAGRAVVERVVSGETLVYGLNTGLGHLRNERVSHEQLMEYQLRIITQHTGGVGSPLPDDDVRAIMAARVAGLARGGSGAHRGAMEMLVAMLNAGVHPIVPAVGSVGASDLMHMAAIAAVAIGQGEARLGEMRPRVHESSPRTKHPSARPPGRLEAGAPRCADGTSLARSLGVAASESPQARSDAHGPRASAPPWSARRQFTSLEVRPGEAGPNEAHFGAEVLPGAQALARAGLVPYVPRPKDGLALISANGASIGRGALAVLAAERAAALADRAGALTLEAIGGNLSPFDAEVSALKPFPGQIAAAAHVRALLEGSYLHELHRAAGGVVHGTSGGTVGGVVRGAAGGVSGGTTGGTTGGAAGGAVGVQDPLSFRVLPQVHGALREQIAAARRAVEVELNAVDDNPLVSVERGILISNGNFHPMVLALAFDALRIAVAHTAMLSERRMNKTDELKFGYPETFLAGAGRPPRQSVAGFLVYTAAALVSELKHLAAPATLHCPPLDYDVEDHATLAPLTVDLTRRALGLLETVLAIECLLAVESLDGRAALPRLGAGTRRVYDAVQAALSTVGPTATSATAVAAVQRALA